MSKSSGAMSATRGQTSICSGPYVLDDLLDNIQLTEEDHDDNVRITCVDFWDGNLYIGTSAGEILHYVLLAATGTDPAQSPNFILASRLRPEYVVAATEHLGVEQILLLPDAGKACILCNGTLTFYVLPELSPAYGGSRKVPHCSWIGGIDQQPDSATIIAEQDGQEIMVCDSTKIRIVRIGSKALPIRTIKLGGCRAITRIGSIACAADVRSYSLLEVVEQQAIPLFEVSSQQDQSTGDASTGGDKPLPQMSIPDGGSLEQSLVAIETTDDASGAQRHVQEQADITIEGAKVPDEMSDQAARPPRSTSLAPSESPTAPGERIQDPDGEVSGQSQPTTRNRGDLQHQRPLNPHIAAPSDSEFLLTTGTSMEDEGVGIFVNLDGDVVRGTLQFERYPESLVVDGDGHDPSALVAPGQSRKEGHVLAVIDRGGASKPEKLVEVQRWDLDPGDSPSKHHLGIPHPQVYPSKRDSGSHAYGMARDLGIARTISTMNIFMSPIVERLTPKLTRLGKAAEESSMHNPETKDNVADSAFLQQMSQVTASILLWSDSSIWWVVKTPMMLRLDDQLDKAIADAPLQDLNVYVQRQLVEQVIGNLRDEEPTDELEFLSFKYLRQKAAILLFMDLVAHAISRTMTYERDRRITAEILLQGEIDPRLVIAVVPVIRNDIFMKETGMNLESGISDRVLKFLQAHTFPEEVAPESSMVTTLFPLIKDYLNHWRRKKGFGSISDEHEVFNSVDAALLHILLIMDSTSPLGRAIPGSVRAELKAFVADGVECFEFAINILERFQRLYVLSLLYMSRRQFAKVLETWKRIMGGEVDLGGELGNGEEEMRNFLKRRKDKALVEEYGAWLARANPKLGVQVFTDNSSQVTFSPEEAMKILKKGAPNAVKDFLEHLVFDKKLPRYASGLITYYLDSVITELDGSEQSRSVLRSINEAYKALTPPKPTYIRFVTDNSIDAVWWRSRLHLLRLLGGIHETASQYDVESIAKIVERHKEELIPETIILSGRQGRHAEAIRLLTHGLGDFDTAISYCVLGGSSTYSPVTGQQRLEKMPCREEQMTLFRCLLEEFFRIDDTNSRIQQTGELLERFSSWFDAEHVMNLVPESWSVDKISPFLESSLRELLTERNETLISRALSSCANLSINGAVVEKISLLGATTQQESDDPGSSVTNTPAG